MPATYESIASLLNNPAAIFDHLGAIGGPLDVANSCHDLMRDAYWKHKDLPFVTRIASLGIPYCMTQSRVVPSAQQELLGAAKRLAYNLASFTWPGWNEPGITPTPDDTELGRGAARLNLSLAHELNRPAEKICDAHWLLGAHDLWARDVPSAQAHFQNALPPHAPASDPKRLLMEGYLLLAHLLAKDPLAVQQWHIVLQSLHAHPSQDAQFFHDQLHTAHKVFQSRF